VPAGIVRGRDQFARRGHQQLLKPGVKRIRMRRPLQAGSGDSAARETQVMKIFTIAVAMLTLIAMPAHAQMNARRHQADEKKTDEKQNKVDEKAYKAALERIPEPKEKYDPWGVARPAEPAKKLK
jgi:hypothetical protein